MNLSRAADGVRAGLVFIEGHGRIGLTYHGWSDVYGLRVGLVIDWYDRHFQFLYYTFLV